MQDFINNILRYPRYLISTVLGIFWALLERFIPFIKNPVTATASIVLLLAVFAFLFFTLEAMLGLKPL